MSAVPTLADNIKEAHALTIMSKPGDMRMVVRLANTIVTMEVWIKQLELKLGDMGDELADTTRELQKLLGAATTEIERLKAEVSYFRGLTNANQGPRA